VHNSYKKKAACPETADREQHLLSLRRKK